MIETVCINRNTTANFEKDARCKLEQLERHPCRSPLKKSQAVREEENLRIIGESSPAQARVRFQAKQYEQCILIPRRQEFSPEDFKKIWWTSDEMEELTQEWKYQAFRIDQGETIEEPRGLEQYTEEGAWKYYKAQRAAINVVLDEQDKNICFEMIAEKCIAETAKFMLIAVDRAKMDYKEARKNRLRKEEALMLMREASQTKIRHSKKKKKKAAYSRLYVESLTSGEDNFTTSQNKTSS